MTTPREVPMRTFPPRGRPGSASSPAPNKPNALAVLGTRNGQIGAVAVLVIGIALWRRFKAGGNDTGSTAAATGSTTSAPATSDTSAFDLYNSLEPLIEHLSGFDGTAAIQKSISDQTAALAQLIKTGQGTSSPASSGPKYPNQTHTIGQVGKAYTVNDLKGLIRRFYPTLTPQQVNEVAFSTVVAPANRQYNLGSGRIPGGARLQLYSAGLK